MLQQTGLDDEQREMAQTLSSAGGMMMRHIEALLTVSRDEMGPVPKASERVDLLALLMSLRALLAVEAGKKGVRLGLCVDAETPRHVWTEPGLLLDVLQNLGGNAVKFTPVGAVAIHVRVASLDEDRLDLRVEVHDTGIGVDKAAQGRIFESFTQADPGIARRFGGSGPGLAIARRRLEACGGRIGVESEPGVGALFWFELTVGVDQEAATTPSVAGLSDERPPRLEELDDAPDEPQICEPICVVAPVPLDALALARRFAIAAVARDDEPGTYFRARKLAARLHDIAGAGGQETAGAQSPARRILLAEDNSVNRMVLNKILTQAGHATVLVADGEAALTAMVNQKFDLILLDVNMPGISGVEAARLYRFATASDARAPILALTADASPFCRAQCAEAGMIDCLTKPIEPEALLGAVVGAVRLAEQAHGASPPAAPLKLTAESAPESLGGVLNLASLDALAKLGGEDFLRDLILQFVDEGGRIVERMIVAVETGDQEAFLHEAHAMSSSAGNLGATDLAGLCHSWCDLGPGQILRRGDDYLEELRREWSFAGLALAKVLAGRGAGASRRRKHPKRRDDAAA